ncbi:MAG: L-rhamnose mutarotase [Cyclobacteriaceae bacterium]|nr:L-rhamnose mutarotase [Cyclobacteriaceae bacterium]
MKRYCLALDLVDDPQVFRDYDAYHTRVWPEVLKSLRDAGIEHMQIYRAHNRLFLIVEAGDNFSLERKSAMDAANPKVQEWETLMWKYQVALPNALPGQKWVLMEKVFEL